MLVHSNLKVKGLDPIKFMLTAVIVFVFFFVNCSSNRDTGLDAAAVAANNRGAALMGQFDYEAARQVFEKLARKYPRNLDIRANLAIAIFNRQKEGDEQTALSILNQILEQDAANLRARYCAGLLELYIGRPAKALEYFQAVIKADPEDAEALYFTGKALMQLSRYEEALDYFKRTVSRDSYIDGGIPTPPKEPPGPSRGIQVYKDGPQSRGVDCRSTESCNCEKTGRPPLQPGRNDYSG
jgi:Tfp pilus assembly protein PilF